MSRMIYREWADPHRAPSIRCWWDQMVPVGGEGHVQRVVPDGCADIIVSNHHAMLVGPTTIVETPRLRAGDHLHGLRFRTEAIGPSLRLPASELRGLTLPLDAVMSDRQARAVADQVSRAVLPHSLALAPIDGRVRATVRLLSRFPATSHGAVADTIGLSSRHLHRLLIEHTGLGSSALRRVARLRTFLRLATQNSLRRQLATLAADAGYADQAHLSREVRRMTETTPSVLLAERMSDTFKTARVRQPTMAS